ncbi:MAG: hypothetical protein ACLQHM_15175 [Limisphaerales bacterium]
MEEKPLVIQRNTGAYVDAVIDDSPAFKSNILESDVTMNIKVYCSCGQPVEVSSNAGGQIFNCHSCVRQLTVPQIEKQEPNQHADAASPKLVIRFKNACENLINERETTLWLLGLAATGIAAMWLVRALLTK